MSREPIRLDHWGDPRDRDPGGEFRARLLPALIQAPGHPALD